MSLILIATPHAMVLVEGRARVRNCEVLGLPNSACRRLPAGGLALHEQMRARTIGSRHRDLLAEEEESGKGCVGLVGDDHDERRGLDCRCACDRLDCRFGQAVRRGWVGFERNANLLQEGIEGSITRRRIALLEG